MDPEEIRAEIERRKQKVKDLKLREVVWSLYSSQFRRIGEVLKKDPELILQEVRESRKLSENSSEFRFGGTQYQLVYVEGKEEEDDWAEDTTYTKDCAITLKVNDSVVFEFKLQTSVIHAMDGPDSKESMREIMGFIDGPWVTEMPELLRGMQSHYQEVLNIRNAPKEAERLKQEMKRFGL
jgi:hypothetical protein